MYEVVLLQEVEDGTFLANSHPDGSTPKLYQNIVSGTKKEVPLKEPSLFLDGRISSHEYVCVPNIYFCYQKLPLHDD